MKRTLLLALLVLSGCAALPPQDLAEQVRSTELAFAKSMAERDLAAFAALIADEAVFLNGGKPLRGKPAVIEHWKRYFSAPAAPFSWRPDLVEVLPSGELAHSEGPVSAPDGRVFARFYSTWRKSSDGRWRIVFDNGHEVCDCPKPGR
jgi:ketosteroid isomerase-like protein